MQIKDLNTLPDFEELVPSDFPEDEISTSYCCDLLSVAMKGAPAQCAWCTVMNNINTLAVASLTDAACVILCCGIHPTPEVLEKAVQQHICLYQTNLPVFQAALEVYKKQHETDL